jgi:hypothetical protein
MECEKPGKIKKLELFEDQPDGVIMIKYETVAAAEKCIKVSI